MSVYQDKGTGKYYFVCTYKDWQGKSHRKYTRGFKLARDAKAAERDFLNQQHGTNCMSFKALYELYIASDTKIKLQNARGLFWGYENLCEINLGIWRGNPRPFNDRDESAACFYHAINLPKA